MALKYCVQADSTHPVKALIFEPVVPRSFAAVFSEFLSSAQFSCLKAILLERNRDRISSAWSDRSEDLSTSGGSRYSELWDYLNTKISDFIHLFELFHIVNKSFHFTEIFS